MRNAVFSWSSVHKPTYCLLNSDVHETPLNASFSALANFHLAPSPLPQQGALASTMATAVKTSLFNELAFCKLCQAYSNLLKMSNVDESPWI